MVSSSKILTVSYGTFSCTAEGFDDPLAVVKDTTQFFRGVVGEDRFFGAEPPQFDPELATELMREQLGTAHGAGTVSLGRPGAASSGAMTAALSAGPARARAEAPALPDDDTIEATAVLTERPLTDGGLTAPLHSGRSWKLTRQWYWKAWYLPQQPEQGSRLELCKLGIIVGLARDRERESEKKKERGTPRVTMRAPGV